MSSAVAPNPLGRPDLNQFCDTLEQLSLYGVSSVRVMGDGLEFRHIDPLSALVQRVMDFVYQLAHNLFGAAYNPRAIHTQTMLEVERVLELQLHDLFDAIHDNIGFDGDHINNPAGLTRTDHGMLLTAKSAFLAFNSVVNGSFLDRAVGLKFSDSFLARYHMSPHLVQACAVTRGDWNGGPIPPEILADIANSPQLANSLPNSKLQESLGQCPPQTLVTLLKARVGAFELRDLTADQRNALIGEPELVAKMSPSMVWTLFNDPAVDNVQKMALLTHTTTRIDGLDHHDVLVEALENHAIVQKMSPEQVSVLADPSNANYLFLLSLTRGGLNSRILGDLSSAQTALGVMRYGSAMLTRMDTSDQISLVRSLPSPELRNEARLLMYS
ncbi:MAG: hypothetical protein SP1CHLAM54_02320 [Chlamydiia bacterium]|nr:hypothetical protein [Chlamydiia bacterium]MCH9615149.1 hypothetical protein [Chlamydiia bacterium]MCH9628529.1 hypothetical protein [Chlamydiia bacterium]